MMNELYAEAYLYYKELYLNHIILFHVGDKIQALCGDAEIMHQLLNEPIKTMGETYRLVDIPYCKLRNVIEILSAKHFSIHIVESIDQSGNFVVPKVKQFIQDMEEDY